MDKILNDSNDKNNEKFRRELVRQHLLNQQWFINEIDRLNRELPDHLAEAKAKDEICDNGENVIQVEMGHEEAIEELESEVASAERELEEAKEKFRLDFGKEWNE